MSNDQRAFIRHILGLPSSNGRTYRSVCMAEIGSSREPKLRRLLADGLATEIELAKGSLGVRITRAAAIAVLEDGETLDPFYPEMEDAE